MKRLLSVFALAALTFSLHADNAELIVNGSLDGKGGYCVDYTSGTWTNSIYTEDLTWNKCVRMELKKFTETPRGGKGSNGALYFGQTDKYVGFMVKPNATYDVSFDVKGTISSVGLRAILWNEMDTNMWKGGRSSVRCTPSSVKTEEAEWRKCKATFRTGKDTKRAAIVFNVWGDSAQQPNFNLQIGQFFMIDNVSVREHASLDAALGAAEVAVTAKSDILPCIVLPAKVTADRFKSDKPSDRPVFATLTDAGDKLRIEAHCVLPKGAQLLDGNKKDGITLWGEGDVLEFFFGTRQYGVGAGGGRYGTPEKWTATVSKDADGWNVVAEFPYSLIGPKELIAFNIARSPKIGNGVSLAPVRGGYNDRKYYCQLVFPAYRGTLEKEFVNVPEALAAKRDELKTVELSAILAAADSLRKAVRQVKMGTAPYLVGTKSPVADFSEPLDIDPADLISTEAPLKVTGAINEIVPLVLTVTNRTKRTENYQVTFHKDSKPYSYEVIGFGEGAPKIHLRQAILMKENDNEEPTRRYDALTELNQASVITIAAGESAVLWCNFDCSNVKAGVYSGFLRVTPLSDSAKVDRKGYHKGTMADYPIQIEVLDALLPPVENGWILGNCNTEALFRYCMDQQCGRLFFSPWGFQFKYDDEGKRSPEYYDLPDMKKKLEWYRKYSPTTKTKFVVGYSAYPVFMSLNSSMKEFTPRWRRAWTEYLQGIALSLEKAGLQKNEYLFEIFDEPMLKNMERDLEVVKIAHEALPGIRKTILWCTNQGDGMSIESKRYNPEHIRQFDPYLTEHCFWHGLLSHPEFQKLVAELHAAGKPCGLYACSTSLNLSLHNYYRLLAWQGEKYGCDNPVSLYTLTNNSWGVEGALCWKKTEYGGIIYRYGDDCLGSIRGEALRLGFTDIRYIKLLQSLPNAKAFADAAVKKVMGDASNPALPQEFRLEAQKLLRK